MNIDDEELSQGIQSQPSMQQMLAQGISPLTGETNHMPAGTQGCIFDRNSPHTGVANSAQVITAPAGRGNVAQAMRNSPPVTNQGTFVYTSS
eukprot:13308352-Ditylum_brightwellii.AAC.1